MAALEGADTRARAGGVSVIATVMNEASTIESLVKALVNQTRPPDEVLISDAGSTDGTREILARLSTQHPALRAVSVPGNRARGRNAAVAAATYDLIACTDAGCVPEPGWLEAITRPFDSGADFVAGFYRVDGASATATSAGLVMVYVPEEVKEAEFLPSARSMAFRRDAWKEAGGFPEDVDFAEDTLFDERMIAAGHRPVFVPEAVAAWQPPKGLAGLVRTMYRWGRGDGEAGLRSYNYRRIAAAYGGTVLMVGIGSGLGVWWAAAGLLPLGVLIARETRHKYRWQRGAGRYVLIPAAAASAHLSSLVGFLVGRSHRIRTSVPARL